MRTGLKIAFFAWLALMIFGKLYSAEETEPKKATDLPEVKAEYDKYLKSIESVVVAYVKILNTEKEKITKAGDLEGAEAVVKEVENVSKIEPAESVVDWKKNANLKNGQKKFNDGLSKNKKDYISGLEKVVSGFVQKKDLDTAKLVKALINDMKIEEVKKAFVGKWHYSKDDSNVQTFLPDGTATFQSYVGSWIIKEKEIEVTWKEFGVQRWQLPINPANQIMINPKGAKEIFIKF